MERLTCNKLNKLTAGCYFVNLASKEEATKYRMLAESAPKYEEIYKKLAEYENAEEQGLLLKLPCKVGETVWFVGNEFVNDYEVRKFIVDETGVDCIQIAKEINGRDYWNSFSIDDFNKTIFINKEEAEQALAKMKAGGKNEID